VPWELENLRGEEGVKQVYKIQIEVLLKPDDAAIDAVQELRWVSLGSGVSKIERALTMFRMVKPLFRSSTRPAARMGLLPSQRREY
jgi:hypothetical protein